MKNITAFFILTFIISLPLYILSALNSSSSIPPESKSLIYVVLVTLAPIISALIIVMKEKGWKGAKKLLARSFDFKRIDNKLWYFPILLLLPVIFLLSFGLMLAIGEPVISGLFPLIAIPIIIPRIFSKNMNLFFLILLRDIFKLSFNN